jgi:rhodanese-related sulfurtransferase
MSSTCCRINATEADNHRMSVHERTPAEALARQQAGALLIDVRDAHERALGTAHGARGIARAELEADPSATCRTPPPNPADLPERPAFAIRRRCAGSHGYTEPRSVIGGTVAWSAAGLPMDAPELDDDFSDRYSRHLRLPEVGLAGQSAWKPPRARDRRRRARFAGRVSTSRPRASARCASPTTMSSIAATCSARSCTPTHASAWRKSESRSAH